MDGGTVFKKLRENPDTANIPGYFSYQLSNAEQVTEELGAGKHPRVPGEIGLGYERRGRGGVGRAVTVGGNARRPGDRDSPAAVEGIRPVHDDAFAECRRVGDGAVRVHGDGSQGYPGLRRGRTAARSWQGAHSQGSADETGKADRRRVDDHAASSCRRRQDHLRKRPPARPSHPPSRTSTTS